MRIRQLTGTSTTDRYVPIDLVFDTEKGPVSLQIEAYIIPEMNAPVILGCDFTMQYNLLIIQVLQFVLLVSCEMVKASE